MKTTVIKNMKNFSLVAIIMASIIFAACSGDENIISEPPAAKTYTLIVNASKGDVTRALSLDGKTLKATWTMGDAVTVYNVTRSTDLGGKLIAQSDGQSTILSGSLTGTIATGDKLKLKFLSPTYSSQDGTLAGIATTCDYAEATVTVSDASSYPITTSNATFNNQQAIVKFTLKDKSTDAAINATKLVVNAGATTINVTPASATNLLYVAIPGISSQTVYLSAKAGSTNYIYEKSDVTLDNGKYYGFTVSMTADLSASMPLTFEAKYANAKVTFTKGTSVANQIEFSTDGSTWNEYSGSITLTNAGDRVSFRGDNATYGALSTSDCSRFSCSDGCYVYGNIMSLISSTGFATSTDLTADYAFAHLFESNNIYNHSTKKLVLPATTLTTGCYESMFSGCISLTATPELSATTLKERCYYCMFANSGLTTAPELPATTLASNCYEGMFTSCYNLTTAPELPATTLASGCYEDMFSSCYNLTMAPELPATTLAERCYYYMFASSGLTTAPELPATSLTNECYRGMFVGCTSLTTAPELPATTLASTCYMNMFASSGLTTVPELPATVLESHCYNGMFRGCTSLTVAPELSATTLANFCYFNMFSGCTGLTTPPATLPATTLANNCYEAMFSGCTSLTTTPALPATTISYFNCYHLMFKGCTSLTTAPELPATTLGTNCYSNMFEGCINLTAVPELPATTLEGGCYFYMFKDCTSLTTPPVLSATTLASDCYCGMFSGCTGLTTAPKLPATTLDQSCYEHMFSGCTSLTTAPALPATTLTTWCYESMFSGCTNLTTTPDLNASTLAVRCYYQMFSGCTSLNRVKCLATDISAFGCTTSWLYNVPSGGTFTKASSMTSWTTGSSGIPSGWTVENE